MKTRLLSFLSLLLIFSSNPSFAIEIENIQTLGIERVSRGTVLAYLPFEVGDNVSEEAIQKSIQILGDTKLFAKISANITDKVLTFNFTENPTVKFMEFNNYEDDLVLNIDLINDLKTNFKLNNGSIFSQSNLDNLLAELKKLYIDNAFYDAKINLKTSLDNQNRIEIEIDFDEGEQAKITSFTVNGNNIFSESEILDNFDIGEPDFFLLNYFTEKDNYSSRLYQAGLERIITKYHDMGHLDIDISKSRVNFNKNNNSIEILLIINEGPQYVIKDIVFKGVFSPLSMDQLNKMITSKVGASFERKKVLKDIAEITDIYKDNGYANADIKLDAIKNKDNSATLTLSVNVDPKNLVYVNRIVINGNNRTQDSVIRRQMMLYEGQLYSRKDIDESINKIKRLGYFSNVDLQLKNLGDTSDKVDLIIDVVETKTGEFSIGLSHSNATGASLNFGVQQNNILGTGNTFNASLSNSEAIKEFSFYFLDPYYNLEGHSISYGYFDKTLNADNLDASAYKISESGYNFGYGIPLSRDSKIFAEFRISDLTLTCGSNLATIDEVAQCSDPNNTDMTTTLNYSFNSLNDFMFPTEGQLINTSFVLALPFSDLKYYKLETQFSEYFPIFNSNTFKFSSRFKYADGYGNQELPFYKRYFEGGASSVRGFDFNSLGQKYASDNSPKGGEVSFVSTVGITGSMEKLGIDNPNMKFITFVDAGILSDKATNFDLSEARASTGVGVNWLTPVGPIGIHYAIPIIKKSNDIEENFSFSLGSKF